MKFYCLILFVLVLSSCGVKDTTVVKIYPVDSIEFRSPAYVSTESINFGLNSNSDVTIVYVDSERRNIFVVNNLGNVIDSFPFPKQITDSRASLEYNNKEVTIFSLSDNILLKLNKKETIVYPVANRTLFLNPAFANFEVINNTALFYQLPLNSLTAARDSEGFFDIKILGIYGISNDTFVQIKSFVTYPRVFQKLKYPEMPPVCNRKNENELYYLFNFSDSLSFIDISTNKLVNYHIEGFPKCKLSPYHRDSMSILSYSKRQMLKNEIFAKILFDKSSSDFILIKLLGIEQETKNSLYENNFQDKPVAVYLVRNFKVSKILNIENGNSVSTINSYFFKGKLYISSADRAKIYVYSM
ncbi:MAG: hypothetical protein H7257_05415 [Taibaiella sp.]|nr:hypothetical protein [Taibaiella sp.]